MPLWFNPTVLVEQTVQNRPAFRVWDWLHVLVLLVRSVGQNSLSMMAAGIAYFATLALFPAITAVISVYGYMSDPGVVQENLSLLAPYLPEQVYTLVNNRVELLITSQRATLGLASILSLLLVIWSAQSGISAMMTALIRIQDSKKRRSFVLNLLISYSLTFVLILGVVVALVAVVILPVVLEFVHIDALNTIIAQALRFALAPVLLLLVIGMLYRYGSNTALRQPVVSYGAILAVALWIANSVALSTYLRNFPNYDQVYGALGTVVALLIWLYLSAFVVLLGASFNRAIEVRAEIILKAL